MKDMPLAGDDAQPQSETQLIADFIREQLIRRPTIQIGPETSLLKSGLVDSMSLADLALFLEDAFDLEVPDVDIGPQNMDTVALIVAYIGARRRAGNMPPDPP